MKLPIVPPGAPIMASNKALFRRQPKGRSRRRSEDPLDK
jgi:hypothetical protein